jgi:hypothetical protein
MLTLLYIIYYSPARTVFEAAQKFFCRFFSGFWFKYGIKRRNRMATRKKKAEEEIVNDVVETVDASTVEEQPEAKPKRKPLVRKVSAAPTKFAPKRRRKISSSPFRLS